MSAGVNVRSACRLGRLLMSPQTGGRSDSSRRKFQSLMEARICRCNRDVIAVETRKLDWLHLVAGRQGDCDATGWVGARHRPRRSRVSGHGGAAAKPGQSTLPLWPPNAMRLRRSGLTTDVVSALGEASSRDRSAAC
jgi:hypothetical protein